MSILWYGIFLLLSYLGVMQVFRLSTYHRYFLRALPVLVAYSAVVAWALFTLQLHAFFVWHLVLSGVWLFLGAQKNAVQGQMLVTAAASHPGADVSGLSRSVSLTRRYYAYSSFLYLGTFAAVYLALFNS